MAVEIEAKMAVESFEPVRAKLREAGAAAAGSHFEVNTFFDTSDGTLLAADQGLRLRLARDDASGRERHVVTWKGPHRPGALKSREEVEFELSSPTEFTTLLARLAYRQTFSFEKRRESWELDRCKVELDEVPRLGKFVEVEGPDERAVMSVRERLGLAHAPMIKGGYAVLLTRHLEEHGLDTEAVRF